MWPQVLFQNRLLSTANPGLRAADIARARSETPANHEGLAHSCCHLLCGLCTLATQPCRVGGLWQHLIAVLGMQQSRWQSFPAALAATTAAAAGHPTAWCLPCLCVCAALAGRV